MRRPIEIRTDSQYTINCLTTWLPSWQRKGYLTGRNPGPGKELKNLDLIKHLVVLLDRHTVRFKYVRAHVGIEGNEGADVRAMFVR